MPRYTIVRPDSMVYVDGIGAKVSVEELPTYFHAIQWYGEADTPYGEIEYAPDQLGRKMPNTRFNDFAPYQAYVDRWQQVYDENPVLGTLPKVP